MAKNRICVLGCGWLGLPLAEELVHQGFEVKGSTTTPAKMELLQTKGIKAFLLSFPENLSKPLLQDFLEVEVLVFNLPPSKSASNTSTYEQLLQQVLEAKPAALKHILFISSTSVYPDLDREVFEHDAVATSEAASLMLRCEHMVQQTTGITATIVRFGGLMGGTRHPGRFLSGKVNVPNPQGPVNMIHLKDSVAVLIKIIASQAWGYTFNACAPQHPTREEFYTQAALLMGLVPPAFTQEGKTSFKIINSGFLQHELEYDFLHPSPLNCLSDPNF